MDPWNIIGWIVLGLFSLVVLCGFGFAVAAVTARLVRRYQLWRLFRRDRNVPALEGQHWSGRKSFEVRYVNNDTGRITVKTGAASMGVTEEQWERMRKRDRLHLVRGPKEPKS